MISPNAKGAGVGKKCTLLMATKVEGCEATVADSKFFGCWCGISMEGRCKCLMVTVIYLDAA